MSLLDPPRCPNCNAEIDLKPLWEAAPKTNRGSRFAGKIGVVCPTCGIKLRVLDSLLGITSVGLFILMVITAAVVGRVSRFHGNDRLVFVGFLVLGVAGFIFFQKSIPRLLTLRLFEDGEKAGFPLVTLAEDLAAEHKASEEADALRPDLTADDGPAWKCQSCGEENPSNFNECWKCLKLRPEAESISGSGTP